MRWASDFHLEVLDGVLAGRSSGRDVGRLVLEAVAGAALYGAVLGLWRSPRLALYVALKLPIVLLATAALAMLFNWIVAVLLGVPLRLAQVSVLTLLSLHVAGILLGALAPVILLFTFAVPAPGLEAQRTHNVLLLLHTAVVGGAGLAGSASLATILRRVCPDSVKAWRVYAVWLLTLAFVGGEVSWVLRPFVGSIYFPVVFLRDDALKGNLYEFAAPSALTGSLRDAEFVLRDILPFLLRGDR